MASILPNLPFHWRELHRRRLERGHFQIHAAIGTDDDLTDFSSFCQCDLRSTFEDKKL